MEEFGSSIASLRQAVLKASNSSPANSFKSFLRARLHEIVELG